MTLQRERPKFLAAVLGAATLAAWSIPAFAETVRVRNIQVSETAGNTAVVIAASARPTFTTWKLEQPARVVVELSGARLGNVDVPLDAGTFAVGLVSASVTEDDSAGPRTRIVLTLRQTSDYQVEAKGNDITLRVIPRVRPPVVAQESAEAKVQAEARTKAEAQTRSEAQAKERAEAQARTEALARAEAQAQAKAEALAKAEAQAQAKAEGLAKAEAQAQAKAEALAKAEAQAQARAETLAKTEAQARARADTLAKTEAQARAKAEAQAKTEAQAQAKAEAQAKTEAQAQAKVEAQAKIEAQAQAKAEAQERALAQARAEAQAKLAAQAKAEAQERALAQRKTEALLKDVSKERLAAQSAAEEHSRAETAAKLEADRLRRELADAHRETAKAKAEASAANEVSQRQKLALTQAESQVKQAQSEAERARKRADSAEGESAAARRRETERDKALRLASEEVDTRQKTLDRIAQKQAEQQSRLAAAERLVSERESTVRDSASKLAEREEEARAARTRRDSLARDASKSSKAEAAAALAEAERQRKSAASAAEQSRQELTRAVASRRQEEARKDEQANLRQAEENRLDKAVAQRKAEELRLADARAERSRLDQERAKLESERTLLETARNELLAEVNRLKTTVSITMAAAEKAERTKETASSLPAPAAKPAPIVSAPAPAAKPIASVPAPAAKPAPVVSAPAPAAKPTPIASAPAPAAKPAPIASAPPARSLAVASPAVPPAPAPAPATTGRPRSVTLRALSHIRSIDFVDEPNRASVIIDVDDSALFSVERLAGRCLSLRIEHSDLPENLARNLDATEYLGPVKIISSYRDPAVRSTVRVDVDLAEDVPNRVRLDGNRIFWDFQKALAPSLPAVWVPPPSVMFVPARKVAGFVATAKDGLWVAQAAPPPYLAPPAQSASTAPAGDTGALPAGSVAPAGAAPEGRQGASTGGSGRYATIGKKRYTGRRIDLDFKGADIHNILRLLADVGQVNVIVADDVRGEVTIKMRDVPWDQALDVVLRSKGLGSVREGNLLRVAPLALLEKELEAEIARQKQIADVLPIETRLIGVSYAEASQLMDKIRDLLSPRGKVSDDHRTNTLIVSDVTKNLQLIEDLVRNLDTQTAQVTIEARIVEANSNFARQIGVQWGGTAFADTTHGNPTGLVFPYNVGIGGGADDGSSPLGGLVPGPRTGTGTTGSPNFLVNMPAPAGLGTGSAIGLTLGSVAGAFNLNLRLSAMESTGAVRILSSPRITTMDNVQANIEQGVSIPVSVVSAMGAQTQFVDAKLHLSVKPHVTNEGTISMVINVTRNEPDFVNTGARGDPSIQKKEAKTTMLVRDGDTAVIGGIYTRNTGLSNSRVPFFSDIPVLGWFFRNRKENDNRSEFLVFITPRIVNRPRVAGQ